MQYMMIGQIFEVIPKNYTDKVTGQVTKEYVEVTVEQVVTDANGFRVKSVDTVNFDQLHYEELRSSIDKYIAVPMEHRQWRDKATGQMTSMMMIADGATYSIFDKNPLASSDKPKTQKTAA